MKTNFVVRFPCQHRLSIHPSDPFGDCNARADFGTAYGVCRHGSRFGIEGGEDIVKHENRDSEIIQRTPRVYIRWENGHGVYGGVELRDFMLSCELSCFTSVLGEYLPADWRVDEMYRYILSAPYTTMS